MLRKDIKNYYDNQHYSPQKKAMLKERLTEMYGSDTDDTEFKTIKTDKRSAIQSSLGRKLITAAAAIAITVGSIVAFNNIGKSENNGQDYAPNFSPSTNSNNSNSNTTDSNTSDSSTTDSSYPDDPIDIDISTIPLYDDMSKDTYGDVPIDEEHFPDPIFREFMRRESFDADGDGYLSKEERKNVEGFGLSVIEGVKSIKGIEYFPNLKRIYSSCTTLEEIDVSQNIRLEFLDVSGSKLTELDVSHNPLLDYLDCDDNPLGNLYVGSNKLLMYLSCNNTKLMQLDITQNPELQFLNCADNYLTELDLSHSQNLTLDCHNNKLTYIDTRNVSSLNCADNSITSLRFYNFNTLICSGNQLGELKLSGDNLSHLECSNCGLTTLEISNPSSLTYLDCSQNELCQLDLIRADRLTYLNCSDNYLDALNLNNNAVDFEEIICSRNQIDSIYTSTFNRLKVLDIEDNNIAQIDVSQNNFLRTLRCVGNPLGAIDISNCKRITDLTVNDITVVTTDK